MPKLPSHGASKSYVRLGESEKQAGSANMAILGDVCESVIGAVFLDAGYDAAKAVVAAAFGARMRSPEHPLRDPKTLLQEWAQARGLPAPLYRETARSGPDHAPEFTISVDVLGYPPAEAKGFAKRLAEQAAAAAFIAREGIGANRPKGRCVNNEQDATRCGFVALIGAPNAGKSTLINQLVGTKVSIVSRKVQTTRGTVRGIALEGAAQIIFVDTPGIFAPKRRLDRAMVAAAWGSTGDADAAALLVDAHKGMDAEVEAILRRLPQIAATKILVLNKIDMVEPPKLLDLAAKLNRVLAFADTFMISALRGHGVAKLRQELGALMPPGPWLYPEDQISDMPLRLLAAEITREKIFERLHDELPYASTVETELWKDHAGRLGADRADDLCDARGPQEDRDRRRRPYDQGDRQRGAQGDYRGGRSKGASFFVRQSARELGRRSRALSRNGAGFSQGVMGGTSGGNSRTEIRHHKDASPSSSSRQVSEKPQWVERMFVHNIAQLTKCLVGLGVGVHDQSHHLLGLLDDLW